MSLEPVLRPEGSVFYQDTDINVDTLMHEENEMCPVKSLPVAVPSKEALGLDTWKASKGAALQ